MKKLNITITAPDVNILAKVLMKINKKLKAYPDLKMEITYQDESVKKLMDNQNGNV